jgi:hypothetical protein
MLLMAILLRQADKPAKMGLFLRRKRLPKGLVPEFQGCAGIAAENAAKVPRA